MPVKKEGEKSWPDCAAARMHINDYRKFSEAEEGKKKHLQEFISYQQHSSYVHKHHYGANPSAYTKWPLYVSSIM